MVLGGGVAVGWVAAIAQIRPWECQYKYSGLEWGEGIPEAVEGPGIVGADAGMGVPELGLQELTTGVDEAAGVWSCGAIVAGERAVAWAGGGGEGGGGRG